MKQAGYLALIAALASLAAASPLRGSNAAATNEAGGNGKANKSGNKGQNIAQSATGLADSIAGGNGGNIAKSALDLASSIIGRDNLVNEETIVVRDTTAQATEGADEEEDD